MSVLAASVRGNPSSLKRLGAVFVVVLAAGCSTIEAPPATPSAPVLSARTACANWYAVLDATIDRAGVRDAGAYRIPGFPYLRVDRFTASFRQQAKENAQAFDAWVTRLKALDASAREYEIRNLPAPFFPVAGIADPAAAAANTRNCQAQLARDDLGNAMQRDLLAARAIVPDNYADGVQTLVYPLARIPFSRGVEKWHQEAAEMFRKTGVETSRPADVVRYESAAKRVTAEQVDAVFSHLNKDALGIPEFSGQDRDVLFQAYAPAFEIETTGGYDRFGPLAWRDGPAPEVDTARPVTYRRLAYTRFHNETLVQLVYTIWFPERPKSGATDILAGRLDGVVIRVTLGADGAPLVYDTIHPCGCYHMFFPTARVNLLPAKKHEIEWAFVPSSLPALAPAQRVVVRIAGRTHYVVGVRPDAEAAGVAYQFAADNDLRALPGADHTTRSAFGPDGIVPGTERGERFLFWPMGIENSGAMRQWGTHATAFIGRRHFDDADLIERRFDLSSGGQLTSVRPQ
jgi:hypothetical protein